MPATREPGRPVEQVGAVDVLSVTRAGRLWSSSLLASPVLASSLSAGGGAKGIWVTMALQTVIDCFLVLPLLEAVVVLDSALRARAITVEEVDRAAGRLSGHRDAARARQVLLLCDPANGSVLETVLRVRMALAGLSGFASQYEVTGPRGQPVFRVDFCAEAVRLEIETDGARWHPDPPRDQARDHALAARGWRVLRFTWAQVVYEPELLLELIREALECRAAA